MGWYVKTEKQLVDSGWTDNGYCYYLRMNLDIPVPMLVCCGMPYQGDYPVLGSYACWNNWMWTRDMLIWIEE